MRFRLIPFGFWMCVVIQFLLVGFIIAVSCLPQNRNIEALKTALVVLIILEALLLPATLACSQKINIENKGVYKSILFVNWGIVSWNEIVEIGCLYTGNWNVTHKHIYFSKRHLSEKEIHKGIGSRERDVIYFIHSARAEESISNYLTEKGIAHGL